MSNPAMHSGYGRVLMTTAISGGATLVVAVVGLGRSKALALLVGPAGLGTMAVFNSLIALLASIACFGITFSGVRQIANSKGPAQQRMITIIWKLCLAGACIVSLACLLFPASLNSLAIGIDAIPQAGWWTAAGVLLAVISAVQMTVLQGLRKINALARVRIIGSVIGASIGIIAVIAWPEVGLAFAVVAIPLGNVVAGFFARPSLEHASNGDGSNIERGAVRLLLTLGLVTLVTGTATNAWQLGIRTFIADHFSIADVGLYQAAFSLSAMNIALVLGALGADYFPRLSENSQSPAKTEQAINEQLSAALHLASPLLFGLMALAPLALKILFSAEFVPAWKLLQWQVLGDLLKIPGWVFAFVLVATARTKAYLILELTIATCVFLCSVILLRLLGLEGVGMGYAISYAVYSMCALLMLRRHGFRPANSVGLHAVGTAALALAILFISHIDQHSGMIVGTGIAVLAAFISARHFRFHGSKRKIAAL